MIRITVGKKPSEERAVLYAVGVHVIVRAYNLGAFKKSISFRLFYLFLYYFVIEVNILGT